MMIVCSVYTTATNKLKNKNSLLLFKLTSFNYI